MSASQCLYFTAVTKTLKEKKFRRAADAFIVVVDDDESVRRALKRLLKSSNFRVEVFASARDFLDLLICAKTSCLILDVRMPGMDGLELQRQLAASHRIPIIFITGHGDEDTRERALRAGAVGFLAKPFSEEALLSAVHSALERTNIELSNLR
jgi:FixJ family two-component response regulator